MSVVKTNERPGTRAQVKHVRSSAYKAREVLNLIRNKSFQGASDLLLFSERRISDTIQKCLNSAAANAENNDGISSEELYVTACYADEGPTMKRWRPRARGRATRIRKRTCHITIILARYTPEELEEMRNRAELKGASLGPSAAEARRRRVEKSKVANDTKVKQHRILMKKFRRKARPKKDKNLLMSQENDEEQESSEENDELSPYGAGSAPAGDDGSQPSEDYQIKGKVSSKIYHPPESPFSLVLKQMFGLQHPMTEKRVLFTSEYAGQQ